MLAVQTKILNKVSLGKTKILNKVSFGKTKILNKTSFGKTRKSEHALQKTQDIIFLVTDMNKSRPNSKRKLRERQAGGAREWGGAVEGERA